jgi:phage baseplate assembly protein W
MPVIPPPKRYFVGFSTQNSAKTHVTTLYDIDLINVDLMTAFQTRVGERLMRPDYGCLLWNYLMEPWTTELSNDIIAEVNRICGLDSRVVIVTSQVYQQNFGFQINMTLQYLPWLVIQSFTVNFENNETIYFDSTPNTTNLIG